MPAAIDRFAGLGGWSTGARAADVQVLWAANYWPEAVNWHLHPLDGWALVDGERMRMLITNEVLAAQSFPANTQRPNNHG